MDSRRLSPFYGALTLAGAILAYFYQDAVTNGVKVTVRRSMACSSQRAFRAVTDFEAMALVSTAVVKYNFVDDPPMHLNMRFSETRRMGKEDTMVTHLQVTEFDSIQQHARMVADSHGTLWDTIFDVGPDKTSADNNKVLLEITMRARAHELVPKLLNPIMQVLFRLGLNSHIDQVKIWCEKQTQTE
jgi:hypothetical protein